MVEVEETDEHAAGRAAAFARDLERDAVDEEAVERVVVLLEAGRVVAEDLPHRLLDRLDGDVGVEAVERGLEAALEDDVLEALALAVDAVGREVVRGEDLVAERGEPREGGLFEIVLGDGAHRVKRPFLRSARPPAREARRRGAWGGGRRGAPSSCVTRHGLLQSDGCLL